MKKLKTKFIVIVSVLCVACLLISGGISYFISYNVVLEEAKQKTIMASYSYSEKLNGWLLAQGEIIDEMVNDLEHFNNYDTDFLYKYFLGKQKPSPHIYCFYIGFSDKSAVFGDGWIPDPDYDVTTRPWYTAALETAGVVYTDPYVDATTGNMVITISRAVKRNGTIIGVAAADIFVNVLTDIVQAAEIKGFDKSANKSYAVLLDANNNFIVHLHDGYKPNKDEDLKNLGAVDDGKYKALADKLAKQKNITEVFKDYDGKEKYFISSPIESAGWTFAFIVPVDEFRKPLQALVSGFGLAIVLSLLTAILYTVFRVNGFINPILKLKQHTQHIANGDLTKKVDIKSKDEIGQLGKSFNDMTDDLKNIVGGIYETSQATKEKTKHVIQITGNVKTISTEISGATEQIAAEAMELKGNINTAKEFLESFTSKIDDVVQKVTEINNNSDHAIKSVDEGLSKLGVLHAIEGEVSQQAAKTYEIIEAFNHSASGINNMTAVISNIADQTNMLALNAAIEAARAGEMGKGFAVVAEQVRKLADESSKAAKEIEVLVETVKAEVQNFDTVKDKSIELDTRKKEVNSEITSDFKDIHKNIKEIVDSLRKVYEQMSSIDKDKIQMNRIMQNISEISENSAAATEEVSAATENQESLLTETIDEIQDLIARIDDLGKTVTKFKLE
ncbi:MAG: methyl-accepting chemotaxis protein [Bacillota bacterium]